VFKLIDTQGISLDILLDSFKQRNLVVDWIDFYDRAIKSGWKLKTIKEKIKYPIIDVYGNDYANFILESVDIYSKL
jgi:alanyl-tRNA synthetase